MRQIILLNVLFCCTSVVGQINITKLDKKTLPQQISFKGIITNAVTWKDSLGVNYVLTTEPDEYISKDAEGNEFKNMEVFAYHYVGSGDNLKLLWRVFDYSKECEFDLSAEFIDEAFSVTDLDKNIKTTTSLRFGANGEITKLRTNLVQPFQDQIWGAIKTMSEKNGLGIVLDKSNNISVIFLQSKYDYTEKVLSILLKGTDKKEKTNSKGKK